MDCGIIAVFPDARKAGLARDRIARSGRISAQSIQKSAGEGRFMVRLAAIIVLASAAGTAIGAGMGALIAYVFGPHGTSGYVIQMVSWAIFAHLLTGMWAGYALLADRSRRDIVRSGPVTLAVRCANIDATTLTEQLRKLGATEVEIRDGATARAPG
jgi:hypothetical protein